MTTATRSTSNSTATSECPSPLVGGQRVPLAHLAGSERQVALCWKLDQGSFTLKPLFFLFFWEKIFICLAAPGIFDLHCGHVGYLVA